MTSSLFDQINYDKAYRKNRYGAAIWVIENPDSLPELLAYCAKNDQKISYKAYWVLEFVCKEKLELLYPYFDIFYENLPQVHLHQSIRAASHICEIICSYYYKHKDPGLLKILGKEHKQTMIDSCFDWLITDQKIACQARAMLCLYYLGKEYDWIYPELKDILEKQLHKESPGYQSRAKKILSKINV